MEQQVKTGIGVLIILIIAITAGFYTWQVIEMGEKELSPVISTQSKNVTAKPIQSADETADWKTYTNDKYGFEFKYLSSWNLSVENGDATYLILRSPVNQEYIKQAQAKIDLNEKNGTPDSYTADAYYFNNDMEVGIYKTNPISDNGADSIDQKIGETIIGGKKGIEYWMGGYGSNYGMVIEGNGYFLQLDFKGCGTNNCIKNRAISSELKQILKTFKFTK